MSRMPEKPILFNADMVRAILEGRKTQTRRIMKPQPESRPMYCYAGSSRKDIGKWHCDGKRYTPPCHGDDILWVRETWCQDDLTPEDIYYRANYHPTEAKELFGDIGLPWRPSIHMPQEYARIFLKVTAVRVERLQDITEEEAKAEGCIAYHDKTGDGKFDDVVEFDLTARDAFAYLWNGTIKKQDLNRYGWDTNPWVWVIEFERVKPRV